MTKTAGQLVRETFPLFPSRVECAVMPGPGGVGVVAAMSLERGGILFWHVGSGFYQVHFPIREGQRLDLDELRDLPGVHWTLEQRFIQHCIDAIAPTIH